VSKYRLSVTTPTQSGSRGAATLSVDDGPEPEPTLTQDARRLFADDRSRYEAMKVIGEGGMGEVHLCRDARIGRDVAMKVLLPRRAGHPHHRARFIREAEVQGRLEHPGIVPVHDVGATPSGNAYFVMKRIRGLTLSQIVHGLARGKPDITLGYSRHRLLAAFQSACLTIEFAHSRGVVHRDLKPDNIMLGDFGEVYVLDWGVAYLREHDEIVFDDAVWRPAPLPRLTQDGEIYGTPGYMAPEQVRGAPIDGRVDVYALGAVLFELLTYQPLHRGRNVATILRSTLEGADARCNERVPGCAVAPELEAIVVRATATDPAERFQSARELHDTLDAYLAGNRDLGHRRRLADQHADVARVAVRKLESGNDGAGSARRTALREAGRALAFAPHHPGAQRILFDLLTRPPEQLPAEVADEMKRAGEVRTRLALRALGLGRLSWMLYLPLILWMGIANWSYVAIGFAPVVLTAGTLLWLSRHPRPNRPVRWTAAVVSILTATTVSFTFGPLFTMPLVLAAALPAWLVHLDKGGRVLALSLAASAIVATAGLEWAGVIPPSYAFEGGRMVIVPAMHHLPEVPVRVYLVVLGIGALITSALMVGRVQDELERAQERLQLQAWQLRQLAPDRDDTR